MYVLQQIYLNLGSNILTELDKFQDFYDICKPSCYLMLLHYVIRVL